MPSVMRSDRSVSATVNKMQRLLVLLLFVTRIDAQSFTHQKRFVYPPTQNLQPTPKSLNIQNSCDSTVIKKIGSKYYVLDLTRNITGIPADIRVHWRTGRIFFTHISNEMRMRLEVMDQNGSLDIITIPGTGQSSTVDNKNDIVYLGTDNGVYKYNDDGTVTPYTASGEDVMYLAVSSDGASMLIATWPQNRVHMITKNGQRQETFSLIPDGHDLTIDTRNNIYFVAAKTSYILRAGQTIPMKIKGLPADKMTGVFVSRSHDVFGMDENGNLYKVDPDNGSANFVGAFEVGNVNSFGLDAFNNVIIGVKGALMKYIQMDASPCPEYV